MYGSLALFALLASMVEVEAATLPINFKRNVPAAREQDLASRQESTGDSRRRLVRRKKNHNHWWNHDDDDDNEDWEDSNDDKEDWNDKKCGAASSSTSSSASPSPWSPSATPSPSSSSVTFDDGMWHPPTATQEWSSKSSDASPTPSSDSWASPSSSPAPQPSSTSAWHHVDTIQGANFFDAKYWNWWSWDDPTHGDVTYVDADTAWRDGLVSVNNQGRAIMKVETTQQVNRGRKSVRIHNNRVWTGGMVMMDATHMPVGCGTWPAWWQNGPNWPEGGEIDILEGVNAFTKNQVSLHTGRGCTMPNDMASHGISSMTTGNFDSFDCSSANTGNQGCGAHDPRTESYGQGFNDIGGGVYVLVWEKKGITFYFHPRYNIPADVTSGSPNPDSWGTPVAHFPSTSCSPYQFFYDHFNIFDTTLCGDWAGADSVWHQTGYAGQAESCAATTGYATCIDYVRNNGHAFQNAYWEVNYVKYFNSTELV